MKDQLAADVSKENRVFIFNDFERHGVELVPGAKVTEFFKDGVNYELADGTKGELRGFDSIVLAMGSRSYNPLNEEVLNSCRRPSSLAKLQSTWQRLTATTDAFNAALEI